MDGQVTTRDEGNALNCQYCGERYGNSTGTDPDIDRLRAHLVDDCPRVPPQIRTRFERACSYGNCG